MEQRFVVEQRELSMLLASMLPICTKRTTLETTASIFFQVRHRELILKSTDLEIALQASCQLLSSTITEPIHFLVPGKRLHDIVKEFEGEITCIVTEQQITLKTGSVVVQLNCTTAEGFPPFPERIENLMHIETERLSELLKGVSFLVPQQHANSALTGISWEIGTHGLIVTATDGHCLAQTRSHTYTLPEYRQWLLPRRAVMELQKLMETMKEATLFVGLCGKQVVFSGESFNFFTKTLNGQFPNYQTVLQRDAFIPAKVDRYPLVKTLRRAASLLSGQFVATQFSFEAQQVRVAMHNKDVGLLKEDVQIEAYTGSPCDIRFYAPYLLQGLNIFQEDRIGMFIGGSTKPVIFESVRPSGMELTYLVMPVAQQPSV